MIRIHTLSQPRSEPEARGAALSLLWSTLAGLLIPVLVVLVGLIAVLLNSDGLREPTIRLGTYLRVPIGSAQLSLAPLAQLTQLVAFTFGVAIVFSLAMYFNRRDADRRARRVTEALHRRVLSQSLRRAEVEGAAAQRLRAEKLIGDYLPLIQQGLSLWYRSIPRNVLALIGCVAVAVMVNPWLAILAFVSGVLLWQLYRHLQHSDQSNLIGWEVTRTRKRMIDLVGRAPLLARLQTQGLADRAFHAELEHLYRRIAENDIRRARIWPLLFTASAAAVAVMVLGLGVNMFGVEDSGLSLPAAIVLGLALTGTVVSAGRVMGLAAQLPRSGDASDAVYHYLRRSTEIAPSEQRVGLAGIRDSVEIEDVTLVDSTGQPILSHLSLSLQPRSMVALMGTDPVSTRALAELLMGFGLPKEGRVKIDGISLRDVHPQALARNVMWIEPDGPIWDGTITENVIGTDTSISTADVVEALEKVGVYERIQRLPDGINTYVTAGDSSLGPETTYGIAVARALLHKPPIVLAMEPPPPAEHLPDDLCLAALGELVAGGSLVIMLPHRLQTLRKADRVVLLNGPRLAGEGKHAELLANSDLYRHLNYLLFNPYRHQR